jgi:methionyl aminopeptidase
MIIKNKKEFRKYKEVCDLSIEILGKIRYFVKIGITTLEIDQYAEKLCEQYGVQPAFKGIKIGSAPEYRHTTCISLNDTVVHGIPNEEKIEGGDIVKVDFGIIKNGYYTDHCFTLGMEPLSKKDKNFIVESRNAIAAGVQQAIAGNTIGDIGTAIESHAQKHNLSIVKEFVGHSIGKSLHDLPDIPGYKRAGLNEELRKGLIICIEAQVIDGDPSIYTCPDLWTIKTKSREKACMFEYIVMVDKKKPRILTNTLNWELFK